VKTPHVIKRVSLLATVSAAFLIPLLAGAGRASAQGVPPGSGDPRLLDELAKDLVRFQEAVKGYRTATNVVIRRAYYEKIKAIKGKYEPLITLNEKDERDRRMDAIAMFEAFLRKYPSDRRWTPDAMFRLAELYYEKSSDEFLVAQESYQKALDSPNPPTGEPPRPDYSNTVGLYRRMLVEFPNYRLLDAAYYLLGFCLGEMGQEAEGRQALLALTCANQYKPLDPPPAQKKAGDKAGPPVPARHVRRLHPGAQAIQVRARGLDAHRRDALRCRRAGPGDLRLPAGAELQGLELLRQGAVQAGLVVLPGQTTSSRPSASSTDW
jgi:tetratricopeptide (TPR) repeat protein